MLKSVKFKLLKLSSGARSRNSTGEIMNFITTDVDRIRIFWFQIRNLVYCPLMVFCIVF